MRPQVEPWNRDQEVMNAAAGETQIWMLLDEQACADILNGMMTPGLRARFYQAMGLAPRPSALHTRVRISRRYCPQCRVVRALVGPPDLEPVPCPKCGTLTVDAQGKDAQGGA